jgi:hypothetical protein
MDSGGSGQGSVVGSFKHVNKSSGSIKCGDFLNFLSYYQLLRKTPLHGVSY